MNLIFERQPAQRVTLESKYILWAERQPRFRPDAMGVIASGEAIRLCRQHLPAHAR